MFCHKAKYDFGDGKNAKVMVTYDVNDGKFAAANMMFLQSS